MACPYYPVLVLIGVSVAAGCGGAVVGTIGSAGDVGAMSSGHPDWTSPQLHGPAYLDFLAAVPGALQCTRCHGDTLHGNDKATSCYRCHDLAATNIVRNGSFEEVGTLPCESGCTISGISLAVGNSAALPGWTVADNPVMVMGANYFPASDGVNCLSLDADQGPGSVFQDLTTQPGVTYDISFDMAADPWNPETDSLDVYWDGQRAGSFAEVSTGSYPDNPIKWVRHEVSSVAATSTTTRLQFVDTDWNNVAPLIDQIRVVPRVQRADLQK